MLSSPSPEVYSIVQSIPSVIVGFFSYVWWLILPIALFFILIEVWLFYVIGKWISKIQWVTLKVKVPRELSQTPKTMEQVFAGFHSIYNPPQSYQTWFYGELQYWLSCELVATSNDITFYIGAPKILRNAVESSIWGQYPAAEIELTEDFFTQLPDDIFKSGYNLFGMDMMQAKPYVYPIRRYEYFEEFHEERRVDTMAALLELMNTLKNSEIIIFQILIQPLDSSWAKLGEEVIAKIMGRSVTKTSSPGLFSGIGEFIKNFFIAIVMLPEWLNPKDTVKETLRKELTSGEKDIIKAIEEKISKLGLRAAVRLVYIAKQEDFTREHISPMIGYFAQFNSLNLNMIKYWGTQLKMVLKGFSHPFNPVERLLKKERKLSWQKGLWMRTKYRWFPLIRKLNMILNIEELATIYHFPLSTVPAPTLTKIEAKRGGPPPELPLAQ